MLKLIEDLVGSNVNRLLESLVPELKNQDYEVSYTKVLETEASRENCLDDEEIELYNERNLLGYYYFRNLKNVLCCHFEEENLYMLAIPLKEVDFEKPEGSFCCMYIDFTTDVPFEVRLSEEFEDL